MIDIISQQLLCIPRPTNLTIILTIIAKNRRKKNVRITSENLTVSHLFNCSDWLFVATTCGRATFCKRVSKSPPVGKGNREIPQVLLAVETSPIFLRLFSPFSIPFVFPYFCAPRSPLPWDVDGENRISVWRFNIDLFQLRKDNNVEVSSRCLIFATSGTKILPAFLISSFTAHSTRSVIIRIHLWKWRLIFWTNIKEAELDFFFRPTELND